MWENGAAIKTTKIVERKLKFSVLINATGFKQLVKAWLNTLVANVAFGYKSPASPCPSCIKFCDVSDQFFYNFLVVFSEQEPTISSGCIPEKICDEEVPKDCQAC